MSDETLQLPLFDYITVKVHSKNINTCKFCGQEIIRNGRKRGVFCSLHCKSEWQKTQKPVDKEWLCQKYIAEGLSAHAIARMVGRDPKRITAWLRGYGIPVRRWSKINAPYCQRHRAKPYWNKEWLQEEYITKQRSSIEIAADFGCCASNIVFFLHKHDIPTRSAVEVRQIKTWRLSGEANGMYGKRGEQSSNWKGGATPERQAFYATKEWQEAQKTVYIRDKATCQRCGKKRKWKDKYCLHHIVSFGIVELRADPDNLIVLCQKCHLWVHSNKNINKELIRTYDEYMEAQNSRVG